MVEHKCDFCGNILKAPWSYDGDKNFCDDGCYTLNLNKESQNE